MSLTIEELDEALLHLRAVPESERGPAWTAYADALLEQRTALVRAEQRITEIKAERAGVGR